MSRFNLEILLGTILILLTAVILIVYGLNEQDRMAHAAEEHHAQAIEVGASLYQSNCSGCHGAKGEGIPGLCPPLNDPNLFTTRLAEVGWAGSLEDYVNSTISTGRITSTRPDQFAGQGRPAMPAWSEEFGGPLRPDQIDSLTAFVMNWEATALGEVVIEGLPVPTPRPEEADDPAARGQRVFLNAGCGGCHTIEGISSGTVGPNLTQIGTIAATMVPGMSAEDYIHQSIVDPSAFVVEGFPDNVMPKNFEQTLSDEELADLVTYLTSLQ